MYAHHQRLLDLLKSLDLIWPEEAVFGICFNNDPNVGLVSDRIRTATFTIHGKGGNTSLGLDDLPVAHA